MFNFKNLLAELPPGTTIEVPIFEQYIIPLGLLTPNPIEHALFYYYLNARRTYEEHVVDKPIVYEDEADPEYNFQGLFTSIAALYNVKPEEMIMAWSVIDRQCEALNLPLLPDEYQYRFANQTKILLQ